MIKSSTPPPPPEKTTWCIAPGGSEAIPPEPVPDHVYIIVLKGAHCVAPRLFEWPARPQGGNGTVIVTESAGRYGFEVKP